MINMASEIVSSYDELNACMLSKSFMELNGKHFTNSDKIMNSIATADKYIGIKQQLNKCGASNQTNENFVVDIGPTALLINGDIYEMHRRECDQSGTLICQSAWLVIQ